MVLPNKEDILGTWKALSGCSQEEGWQSITLVSGPAFSLRAGRCFPDNAETLLVQFGDGAIPAMADLPAATGFTLARVQLKLHGQWLALVRQPEGSLDLFTMVVLDLVSTLLESRSQSSKILLNLFMSRLKAWMDFMKKGGQHLSPEAELGLVGELTCMALLLDAGASTSAILDCWKGPEDGLQDFQPGSSAIEVKSTLAKEGFPASILSLEQLDDSIRQPLLLCAHRFALAPEGRTLPTLVNALKSRMEPFDTVKFDFSLLHAGYLDIHSEHYVRQFDLIETRFMLVDDHFPRLIRGNTPPGISWAKYTIDLDTVETRQYQINEVIAITGII